MMRRIWIGSGSRSRSSLLIASQCAAEAFSFVNLGATMITTTIRCDEADKRAAAEGAEYYGFDLS